MRRVAWAALAGAVGWVAAPWVSMARRGTIDQRTVAAWSREGHERPEPTAWIPEPRRGDHDDARASSRPGRAHPR